MIKAIIFDFTNTIFDAETKDLFPEVTKVLSDLYSKEYQLALISRAEDVEVRREEIRNLEIDTLFEVIDIVPRGTDKNFEWVIEELEVKPFEVLIVGDRVKSEIAVGNRLGCTTVWVPRGRFAKELPETKEEKPDFKIPDLTGVVQILNSL